MYYYDYYETNKYKFIELPGPELLVLITFFKLIKSSKSRITLEEIKNEIDNFNKVKFVLLIFIVKYCRIKLWTSL